MDIEKRSLYILRINADIFCLIAGLFFALYITEQDHILTVPRITLLVVFIILIWLLSSKTTNLYDDFRGKYFSFEASSIFNSILILSISLIVLTYSVRLHLSRLFLLVFAVSELIILFTERYAVRHALIYLRRRGRNLRNLIIIGAGDTGLQFYQDIKNSIYGIKLAGFLDDQQDTSLNGEYLGKISDLDRVLENKSVDEVVVALPGYDTYKLDTIVRTCERHAVRVKVIPDYLKYISNNYNVSVLGRFPVIALRAEKLNEIQWRVSKRFFDFIGTVILFVFVFSWLWPLIMIAVKIDSPGKIFFKQERWGKNNRKFNAYKFRSMVSEAAVVTSDGKYQPATKGDERVTRVGRILRRYNLDELPQFINVLKGDMSIIGPRPHPTPLNLEARDMVSHYMLRHLVKPGITGWAQVKGYRGEASSPEVMEKRVEHDLWYIENWSYLLDIQIVLLTIWNMIKGDPNAY